MKKESYRYIRIKDNRPITLVIIDERRKSNGWIDLVADVFKRLIVHHRYGDAFLNLNTIFPHTNYSGKDPGRRKEIRLDLGFEGADYILPKK